MDRNDPAAQALMADVERKARRRVRLKLFFMWHLAVFALVNVGLIAINLAFSPLVLWFIWPLVGWGVALGIHAFVTFGMGGVSDALMDAEVERELTRRASRH